MEICRGCNGKTYYYQLVKTNVCKIVCPYCDGYGMLDWVDNLILDKKYEYGPKVLTTYFIYDLIIKYIERNNFQDALDYLNELLNEKIIKNFYVYKKSVFVTINNLENEIFEIRT